MSGTTAPAPGPDPLGTSAAPAPGPDPLCTSAAPAPGPDPLCTSAAPAPGPDPLATSAAPAPGWGVRNLSVRYGTTLALDQVSLTVPAGQVTVVAGGDGAGKTTLLRCLAGALAPDDGEVRMPGAERTGYLPSGSGVYPDLTVAENMAFRAGAYGLSPAVARDRTAELVATAGLTEATGRLAGQLSGGMRRKLGVIAAMVHRPDLLVLDEPTTGIDPVSRAGLRRLIVGAAAGGAAVVLATTYLDEAERAASVLVLDGGRELGAGTPAQIRAAMPGTIVAADAPADGEGRARSWRRAGRWRVWVPPGAAAPAGEPVPPDLQDAVTVAALARETERKSATGDDTPSAEPSGPADRRVSGGRAGGGSARGRQATNGPACGGSATGGQARPGQARPGQASPGQASPGQASAGRAIGGQASGGPALAECTDVTRMFGQLAAVRDASLRVGPGEIVGLLGANGAGKTTLIRMLLGLLPATSGTVALFGEPPSRGTRRRLGYVPQGLGLYDDLTVAENMRFSAAVFGVPPQQALVFDGNVPVGRLPLGVQRRAAFAQALEHRPDLLILDEPTSGVDPLGRARLWDTVRSAAEGGAGVLVTTHHMEEATECDRLVIMADGAVVAEGTPAEVIAGATVTVVRARAWQEAFGRLEARGLDVALAGHDLRVPGADEATVRRLLGGEDAGEGTRTFEAPATLEERFFQIVLHGEAAGAGLREEASEHR